jgi:serine protease Do/serine protease DegQ
MDIKQCQGRRIGSVAGVLAGVWLLMAPAAALPPQDSQGAQLPSLAPMLEKATPAVVNIATIGRVSVQDNPLLNDPFFRRFFGAPEQQQQQQRRPQSLGSGVIVDAERGYVLTNNHVIDKAQEIRVTLRDGRTLDATLVGADPEADVAVIQIPAEKLTALPLADSDKLRVGDFVVAIGNPFGLGQTVTSGIVSALGRSGLGIEGYEDFIQTDASINPGNSGGALVNLRGELVGINTAIVAPSGGNVGIGFAIPVNMASELMAQLVEYGEIRRGRLGVSGQTLTQELAKAFGLAWHEGVLISSVEPDAAAAKAGLLVGDVVTAINDHPVKDTSDLKNAIGLLRAGAEIKLGLVRGGKPATIVAKIEAPAAQWFEGRLLHPRFDGMLFGTIPEDSPLHGKVEGMLIFGVSPGTPAWNAGLRKGDVLLSINRVLVKNREQMEAALKRSAQGVLLNIRRGNNAMFVLLP